MNRKWDKIRHYLRIHILLANNPYPLKQVDSTFCMNLKKLNWIPTTCIEYISNEETKEITKKTTTKLKRPMNVFIRHPNDYTEMFIHYFPYIDNIHLNSEFVHILDINDGITPQDVVLRLLEYINDSTYSTLSNIDIFPMNQNDKQEKLNTLLDNPPKQPYRRKFIESISTMVRLYHFLYTELTNDKRYMKWPIFFLPDSHTSNNTDLCVGQFLFINEVIWDDPTHLLPEHCLMKHFYKELERLFIDILQIPLIPNIQSYFELLKTYSQKNITDELTNNIWKIFENLNDQDNDAIISKNSITYRFRYSTKNFLFLFFALRIIPASISYTKYDTIRMDKT